MAGVPAALNIFEGTHLWLSKLESGTWQTQSELWSGATGGSGIQKFSSGSITISLTAHLGVVYEAIAQPGLLFVGNGAPDPVQTIAPAGYSEIHLLQKFYERTSGAFFFNNAYWLFCELTTTGGVVRIGCLMSATGATGTWTEANSVGAPVLFDPAGLSGGSFQGLYWDGVSNLVYLFMLVGVGGGGTPQIKLFTFNMTTGAWAVLAGSSTPATFVFGYSTTPVAGFMVVWADGTIGTIYSYQGDTYYRRFSSGVWGSEIGPIEPNRTPALMMLNPAGDLAHCIFYTGSSPSSSGVYATLAPDGTISSDLATLTGSVLGWGLGYVDAHTVNLTSDDHSQISNTIWSSPISAVAFTRAVLPLPAIETGQLPSCAMIFFAPSLVPPPLTLACPVNTTIAIGVPYSGSLIATGGTPPLTFSIIAGALPPGLTLNSSTGVISGIPTLGTYSYTAKVIDSLGAFATATCHFSVQPPQPPNPPGVCILVPTPTNTSTFVAYNEPLERRGS